MAAYGLGMLVRLLLALLLASFAVPAAATARVCHEAPVTGMAHHGAPEKQAPAHICVGCVPLADLLGTPVTPRILSATRQPDTRVVCLDLGGAIAPALPPPRTA